MSLLHSLSNPGCQAHIERDVCSESRACGCCTTKHMLDVTGLYGGDCCAHKQDSTHLNVPASRYHTTGTNSFSYIPGAPGGVCFVDNYFDENSECFREKSVSLHNLAPSGVAFETVEMNLSDVRDVGGLTEIVATVSSVSTRHDNGILAASDTTSDGCCGSINSGSVNIGSCDEAEDDDDDDGSHFGTSMLQNKKKPRSRLKKFLTSLLSLSSSSSDDENYDNRPAPAQSFNWQ